MNKNSVDKGCIQVEILLQAEGHIVTKQRQYITHNKYGGHTRWDFGLTKSTYWCRNDAFNLQKINI
jgi:hypothetical protein